MLRKHHCAESAFFRVYDLLGEKICKGRLSGTDDSTLILLVDKKTVRIAVVNIGFIKTKHSAGNNILIGSVIGAVSFAILGAASANPDDEILGYTAGEGAASGAITGAVAGAAIGGITILFKNSQTFQINGSAEKWNQFKTMIYK